MWHTLKTNLFHLFLLGMFCLFLSFPIPTLNGAASGLLLWYNILLPSLLPFIILTSIIIKTQAFSVVGRILGSLLGRIFRTSNDSSIAIIVGFLCGYPMGAKTISDLYENQRISTNEAQYLLSFCNNTSPMFIISFFLLQILGDTNLLCATLISLYIPPILVSIITRRIYHIPTIHTASYIDSYAHSHGTTHSTSHSTSHRTSHSTSYTALHTEHNKTIAPTFSFQLLDEIIIESITLIMKIGGYIMIFSIFISLINPFVSHHLPSLAYFVPLLEITNGLEMYRKMNLAISAYHPMIFLVSFGGLCAVGQTGCVITSPDIKISHYFVQKIITAIIAVIISLLYVVCYT